MTSSRDIEARLRRRNKSKFQHISTYMAKRACLKNENNNVLKRKLKKTEKLASCIAHQRQLSKTFVKGVVNQQPNHEQVS